MAQKDRKEKKSFVLEVCLIIFSKLYEVLHKYSPIFIIIDIHYAPFEKDDKRLVDSYVMLTTALTFLVLVFSASIQNPLFQMVIIFFGGCRVFEILVVQTGALFFDYYKNTMERMEASRKFKLPEKPRPYVIQGYLRITILLLLNFAEIVFWFSIFYIFLSNYFFVSPLGNVEALSFSFYTMTTFGHFPNSIKLLNDYGYIFTLLQSVIGLLMTLLILSRFIGLLPRAPSSDEVEQKMERESKT